MTEEDEQQHRTFEDCDDNHWTDEFVGDDIVLDVDELDDDDGVRDGSGEMDDGMDLLQQLLCLEEIILIPWMDVCP